MPQPGETSPGVSTWDATPPHRPGAPDYNGAALVDRSMAPPVPQSMPTSALLNTTALSEVAIGSVVPNAIVSVKFAAGAPVLDAQAQTAGATPGSSAVTITVVRTPSGAGAGDIFLWWDPTLMPAHTTRPRVTLNGAVPALSPAAEWYTDSGTGHMGVRVITQDHTATAADFNFTVAIH